MKKVIRLTIPILLTMLTGCNMGLKKNMSSESETTKSWSNPIYSKDIDDGRGFRDPYILKDGDWWYLTGTMFPHFEGDKGETERTKGVPLYKTQDFKSWEFVDIILKRPDPSEGKWYQNYFWAPEIFMQNGKYYVIVSCSVGGHYEKDIGTDALQAVCIARADNIEGPYTVLTDDKPLLYGNDGHLFKDDDGKIYLFVSGIQASEIDLDNVKLKGNMRNIVTPIPNSEEWNAHRPGVGFEGPYTIKKNGIYYLFYSSWARGYEIGIAENIGGTPLKKWTMHKDPFYGAMNKQSCDYNKAIYEEGYYEHDYREAGHNSVFLGPDGEDWIAAHVFEHGDKDRDIKMVIDRLYYGEGGFYVKNQNGERVNGPTYGKQTIDITNPTKAEPKKALDTWVYCNIDEDYEMPQKIDILFDNGWRESYNVLWNGSLDTSMRGESIIEGTVMYDGISYPCQLIANIKG